MEGVGKEDEARVRRMPEHGIASGVPREDTLLVCRKNHPRRKISPYAYKAVSRTRRIGETEAIALAEIGKEGVRAGADDQRVYGFLVLVHAP
jgi:hypothetical protein